MGHSITCTCGTEDVARRYAAQPQPLGEEAARWHISRQHTAQKPECGARPASSRACCLLLLLLLLHYHHKVQHAPQHASAYTTTDDSAVGAGWSDARGSGHLPALTVESQLRPPPVFAASCAWKGRANQEYSDENTLGVATSTNRNLTFHRWLRPWPADSDRSKDQSQYDSYDMRRMREAAQWGLAAVLTAIFLTSPRVPPPQRTRLWQSGGEPYERHNSSAPDTALGESGLDATELAQFVWRKRQTPRWVRAGATM